MRSSRARGPGSGPEATGGTAGFSRRGILRSSAAVALAAAAGCDAFSTSPSGSQEKPSVAERTGREAPVLAAQVKAGKLPSLNERLPAKPLVVRPIERTGEYGGVWHSVVLGPANTVLLYMTIGYEQLVAWPPDFKDKVVPNIAESFDVGNGGREYTFHLRRGMKWSDGAPFGADDILFVCEDILGNEDFASTFPFPLTLQGRAPTVEKLDTYTVRFSYPRPHGLFLEHLATPTGNVFTTYPKHYLKKFHKKYNRDVDALAKKEQFDSWVDLFYDRADGWGNKDLPKLLPWQVVEEYGSGSRVVVERNPYYWKTDPDGRQLPYLDRVIFDVIKNKETILLKAANGELSMDVAYTNALSNKPVLARNRGRGDYDFFNTAPTAMNDIIISLNLTHEDAALREVFRNRDFRVGLSHAINRQQIIETIMQSQGEPWQASPRPESGLSDHVLAKQYTEYDVDRANRYLDRAYSKKDADGFRLRPDGKRIFFTVEVAVASDLAIDSVGALEMVRDYWRKVGVDMRVNGEDRGLLYERKAANKHDAVVWFDKMGLHDAVLDPRWYFPFNGESNYAIPWANWYVDGAEPKEKPSVAARRQMELYDQLQGTVSRGKRRKIFAEILRIAREEFYVIGIFLPTQGFGIVKTNFHNVLDPMPEGWLYPTPGPSRPEQYFISG